RLPAAPGSALLVASGPLPGPGAANPPPPPALVWEGGVPDLLDDQPAASLREAIRQPLSWLERRPADSRLVFGSRVVTVREQVQALGRLVQLLEDDPAPEVLETRLLAEFDVLRSAGRDDGGVLVTGYHEPVVPAAPV